MIALTAELVEADLLELVLPPGLAFEVGCCFANNGFAHPGELLF
jgi:hypothetical protein